MGVPEGGVPDDDWAAVVAEVTRVAPGLVLEPVPLLGPPTSFDLRGAVWAEAAVVAACARWSVSPGWRSEQDLRCEITAPGGGRAVARCLTDGSVEVEVDAGPVVDEVVLRSYAIGAAHQALGWVGSEGIAVDAAGLVHDLTIRSFGILRARDTPPVTVSVRPSDGPMVNGSDAVSPPWPVPAGWPTGSPHLAHRSGWFTTEERMMSTPIGPYTPSVRAGPWLICSGQLGLGPTPAEGHQGDRPSGPPPRLVDGGAPAQLAQALANAARLLADNGATTNDVVKTTVFVTDMDEFAAVNEAYAGFFGDHRPARSVVGVAGLPMGAAVEVEVWAYVRPTSAE